MSGLPTERHAYVTPAEVWARLEENANAGSIPDGFLAACEAATRRINGYCRRWFFPWSRVAYYDLSEVQQRGKKLSFGADLISLNAAGVKIGRTSPTSWTEGTEYWLKPLNGSPKKWLNAESGYTLLAAGEQRKGISIDALWGWSDDVSPVATATLESDITSSVTTISMKTAAGDDSVGMAGMLVKIGDELMYVTVGKGSTPTVERGAFGTTAAAHSADDSIYRQLAIEDIRESAHALVARAWRQVQSAYTDVAGMGANGELVFAKALPADVKDTLDRYRRTMFA